MKYGIIFIIMFAITFVSNTVVASLCIPSPVPNSQKIAEGNKSSITELLTNSKYEFFYFEKESERYLAAWDMNSELVLAIGLEKEVKTTSGESFFSFGVEIVCVSEKDSYILLLTNNGALGLFNKEYLLLVDTNNLSITKIADGCSSVKLEDKVIMYDYVDVIDPQLYISQIGFTCYGYSGEKLPNTFVSPCTDVYTFEYEGNKYLLYCNIHPDGSADGKLLAPSLEIEKEIYGGMTHYGELHVSTDIDDTSFMVKIIKNNNVVQGVVYYSFKETPVSIEKII